DPACCEQLFRVGARPDPATVMRFIDEHRDRFAVALLLRVLNIGWDGSAAAESAQVTAARLFPGRPVVPVSVKDGHKPGDRTTSALVEVPLVDGHLERGRAIAAALTAKARAEHAALMAVGSHGRSALHEILLGSVAMATLHHAHRPVLVVPCSAAAGE
ncbi:universal stress protein, partial [Actinoplanes sp. NEAU-A12]